MRRYLRGRQAGNIRVGVRERALDSFRTLGDTWVLILVYGTLTEASLLPVIIKWGQCEWPFERVKCQLEVGLGMGGGGWNMVGLGG